MCSKDLKRVPSNTLKLFATKYNTFVFFSLFMKSAFGTNSRSVHKNMHVIKKKEIFDGKVFNWSVSAKFFPMLMERPYFGVVINPKNYLNHE